MKAQTRGMDITMAGQLSMVEKEDINYKLGGIEATQGYILKSLNIIEGLASDFAKTTAVHAASLDAAHKRLDKIEPVIEDYETNRDEAKGVWKAIMIVAGAVSFVVTAIINLLPSFGRLFH